MCCYRRICGGNGARPLASDVVRMMEFDRYMTSPLRVFHYCGARRRRLGSYKANSPTRPLRGQSHGPASAAYHLAST